MTSPSSPEPWPTPIWGNEVYDRMKRHEIEVLHRAGFSIRQVAKKAGVSRNAVRRILRKELPERKADAHLGRPLITIPFQNTVEQLLKERDDLPTVEILRQLRQQGYAGSKNPIYRLVHQLRKTVTPVMVRFEGFAGEFSQNDFGMIHVHYENGTEETLHFFAARLKYSRWIHVQIVPNEQVEALARSLLASFESFGGVPLVCVFDNPKTVVLSRYGNVIQWNETFAQVALDYRFAPELCTPRRGQEKGSVENLIGFSKKNFFLPRRFHDRADLEVQLTQWLHEVNYERPCRATGEVPLARMEKEREHLRPLPIPPSEYALRFPVRVGPTAYVTFRGIRYSMPAEAMGINATLFLYPKEVRIVADRFNEVHPRDPPNGVSTLPKHATSALAAVAGRRGEMYFMRQRLLEVGPVAEAFLTEVVHAHPHTWGGDVKVLFDLLQVHGPERMRQALQEAVDRGWYASEPVVWWLRKEVNS